MAGLDVIGIKSVYDALKSHAMSLGVFEAVVMHEPASPPPGAGVTLAMTESEIGPAPSGLSATSVSWEWAARLYLPRTQRPAGDIDPKLTAAAITLLASYAADVDLTGFGAVAGLVREVDVLGTVTRPAWLDWGGTQYRTRDLSISIIINDAYVQGVA